MKIKDLKHNHTLTDLLKVILFSIVMLLPFFAALPSQLYFAFNEHAQDYTHQTITTTYQYETNELNSVNDIVVGNIYHCNIYDSIDDDYIFYNLNGDIEFNHIYNLEFRGGFDSRYTILDDTFSNNSPNSAMLGETTFLYNVLVNYSGNNATPYNVVAFLVDSNYLENIVGFDFVLNEYNYESFTTGVPSNNFSHYFSASTYLGNQIQSINTEELNPLQAFYTANEQVWEQPIFSWVQNGIFTNSLGAFVSVFGITQNSYLNYLLTYWLAIMIIYIILDIIIRLITYLTHMIGSKSA